MAKTIFQAAYDNDWTATEGLILSGISPDTQNTQPTGRFSRCMYNSFWYAKSPGFPIAGLLGTAVFGYITLPLWALCTFVFTIAEHDRVSKIGNSTLGKRIYSTVGWTPLHFAAAGNAIKVAQGLIFRNADISILAEDGRSFITIAKELKHTEFLESMQAAINSHIEKMDNDTLKTKYIATLTILKQKSPQSSNLADIGDDGSDAIDDREERMEQSPQPHGELRHRITQTNIR